MPRYAHDCELCTSLGEFKSFDLYYCPQQTLGTATVIARNSSEPSDYSSGLWFGRKYKDHDSHPLGEAYRRARDLKLDVSGNN